MTNYGSFFDAWSPSQAQQVTQDVSLGVRVLHFGGVSLVLGRANQCMSLFFAEAAYGVVITIFSLFLFLALSAIELTFPTDSF